LDVGDQTAFQTLLTAPKENPMTEKNRKSAITFLNLATSGRVDEAYDQFVGPGFRHHNPFFEGSAESLKAGMKENASK
jgi:hypothetical protein